jgi:hypothetical protein
MSVEESILRDDLLPAIQGSIRRLAYGISFSPNDLGALVNVVGQAKEWRPVTP